MSIVESLKKLVDPVRARQEEQERRTARQRPDADDQGPPPQTRRCRVCGHQGPEPLFCPDCLAETMRPL